MADLKPPAVEPTVPPSRRGGQSRQTMDSLLGKPTNLAAIAHAAANPPTKVEFDLLVDSHNALLASLRSTP